MSNPPSIGPRSGRGVDPSTGTSTRWLTAYYHHTGLSLALVDHLPLTGVDVRQGLDTYIRSPYRGASDGDDTSGVVPVGRRVDHLTHLTSPPLTVEGTYPTYLPEGVSRDGEVGKVVEGIEAVVETIEVLDVLSTEVDGDGRIDERQSLIGLEEADRCGLKQYPL